MSKFSENLNVRKREVQEEESFPACPFCGDVEAQCTPRLSKPRNLKQLVI